MASFRPALETCPQCKSKGHCHIHAYYTRSIVDFINGRTLRQNILILRLRCDCGHTHAILPDFIIPYSSYSLLFILNLLAMHFSRTASVELICERFSITPKQFYKWLKLWGKHKQLWLGALDNAITSSREFMNQLLNSLDYSGFARDFIRRFSFSFLQAHENPARYCQQVFDP